MSRNARIDDSVKEEWVTVRLGVINMGYSPYKPDKSGRLKDSLVILHHFNGNNINPSGGTDGEVQGLSMFNIWAAFAQQYYRYLDKVCNEQGLPIANSFKNIVLVDISSLLMQSDNINLILEQEASTANLEKKLSKPLVRTMNKLLLLRSTIVSVGPYCQLLLKMLSISAKSASPHQLTFENINRVIMIQPELSTACVNSVLRGPFSSMCQHVYLQCCMTMTQKKGKGMIY
jgi:hypothetical protein